MQQIDLCPLILTDFDLTQEAHALSGRPLYITFVKRYERTYGYHGK